MTDNPTFALADGHKLGMPQDLMDWLAYVLTRRGVDLASARLSIGDLAAICSDDPDGDPLPALEGLRLLDDQRQMIKAGLKLVQKSTGRTLLYALVPFNDWLSGQDVPFDVRQEIAGQWMTARQLANDDCSLSNALLRAWCAQTNELAAVDVISMVERAFRDEYPRLKQPWTRAELDAFDTRTSQTKRRQLADLMAMFPPVLIREAHHGPHK